MDLDLLDLTQAYLTRLDRHLSSAFGEDYLKNVLLWVFGIVAGTQFAHKMVRSTCSRTWRYLYPKPDDLVADILTQMDGEAKVAEGATRLTCGNCVVLYAPGKTIGSSYQPEQFRILISEELVDVDRFTPYECNLIKRKHAATVQRVAKEQWEQTKKRHRKNIKKT